MPKVQIEKTTKNKKHKHSTDKHKQNKQQPKTNQEPNQNAKSQVDSSRKTKNQKRNIAAICLNLPGLKPESIVSGHHTLKNTLEGKI